MSSTSPSGPELGGNARSGSSLPDASDLSRRGLLQKGLSAASGIIFFGFALEKLATPARGQGASPGAAGAASSAYDPSKHYYGYAIDIDKCIGCGRCADACKNENKVSREDANYRTWIERYVVRQDGSVAVDSPDGGIAPFPPVDNPATVAKSFFVPKMCSHCEKSPCEQVCPVGASFFTPDGVVLIDQKYCIGCAYCIQACPYGCRYFNEATHTAGKCTLCYHRITKGLVPACAEVCPTGARVFGDLKDKQGTLVKFLAEHKVQVLKPHMNTRPKLFYHDLDKEVR